GDARHRAGDAVAADHRSRAPDPRRAADRRGGDPRHRLPARLAGLWRALARGGGVLLGGIPRVGDLGAGRPRTLAADERALADSRALHNPGHIPGHRAYPNYGAELRADHAAADLGAAFAQHALR